MAELAGPAVAGAVAFLRAAAAPLVAAVTGPGPGVACVWAGDGGGVDESSAEGLHGHGE